MAGDNGAKPNEVVEVVKGAKILVEHRTRRQGGNVFHIFVKGTEIALLKKEAVRMARDIIEIVRKK